jgi:hypothetical protein
LRDQNGNNWDKLIGGRCEPKETVTATFRMEQGLFGWMDNLKHEMFRKSLKNMKPRDVGDEFAIE